ncbi:protein stum homolog [Ciona intestinalis]
MANEDTGENSTNAPLAVAADTQTDRRKHSSFVGQIIEVHDKKGLFHAAIPIVPSCISWLCLLFNLFTPGIGTFIMAICALCGCKTNSVKPNKCKDFALNILCGFLQLLLAIILVGWIWSIYWGINIVTIANETEERKKADKKRQPIYKQDDGNI